MARRYYSTKEILDKIREYEVGKKDITYLYKESFINHRSKVIDSESYCTEIIAERLLNNIELLKNIKNISRETTYKTKSHQDITNKKINNTNRKEEITAINMLEQSNIVGIGKIIDYQIPLKNKRDDHNKGIGKIDLLAVDEKRLRILELKIEDSSETMLRCVLEAYTYSKVLNKEKFFKDFELDKKLEIVCCPLVFLNSKQYKELEEERKYLKELMKKLKIETIVIDRELNKIGNEEFLVKEKKEWK